jgi:hypothetical protein
MKICDKAQPEFSSSAVPRVPKNWTAHFSSSPATRRATSRPDTLSSTEADQKQDLNHCRDSMCAST